MGVDFAELKGRIRESLAGMNGVSVDANGFYYTECDKDYREALDDSDIADVLAGRVRLRQQDGTEKIEHAEPYDAFQRLLVGAYWEEMARIEDEVLEAVRENDEVALFIETYGVTEDQLRDCLYDVWFVSPPYDDYLKQEVCMDIMLDTGDMNWGFACNNIDFSEIESVDDFDNNSSLLWLCEQQGVTREELLSAYNKGTAHSDEVIGLQNRSAELMAELQQFGFVAPRFAERVIHTGAYQEYARLQGTMDSLRADIALLTTKYEQNNMSYQEYLKKHFDRFERLDPMTEEQFKAKRAEVLEHINAKLETANAEYRKVKDRLDFGTDYRRIAMLAEEHRHVQWQLGDLAKTEEYKKAEFIDSVVNEVNNNSGSVGVVMFLVKMPLEEAIRLQEVIEGEASLNNSYHYDRRTGKSFIVLDKDVRVGLMDDCNGSGSVFEIKLLKDVEIPVKALYKAVPDRGNGNYGFQEIYGMNDEEFAYALKEIREVGPEKEGVVRLIADAELRVHESKAQVDNELELGC